MAICIKQLYNNPIKSNCYILYNLDISRNCIIIDPGARDPTEIFKFIQDNNLNPEYIVLTHEHFDHIWSCNELRAKYNVKIICSKECACSVSDNKKNHSLFYNQKGFVLNNIDLIVEDINFNLKWLDYNLSFFIALGHTASGICFTIDRFLFTGDTLLKGAKTVTKLYTGSKEGLAKTISIINTYKNLNFKVYPGHGDSFLLDDYDTSIAL